MVLPGVAVGVAAPQLELVEVLREILEAPGAGEHQVARHVVVVLGRIGDVLALAGDPASLDGDRGRHARPPRRRPRLVPLQRVAVHLHR